MQNECKVVNQFFIRACILQIIERNELPEVSPEFTTSAAGNFVTFQSAITCSCMSCKYKRYVDFHTKSRSIVRHVQTNASLIENCTELTNRNPRNLELMRIARKPAGYHLEKPGRNCWNKLVVTVTARHVNAEIHHYRNGAVISASSKEWGLRKQLYKTNDTPAFANVGKLIAQRCLESGISAVSCDIDTTGSAKLTALIEEIKKNGLSLEEPPMYEHANPWDQSRMPKPWTIQE